MLFLLLNLFGRQSVWKNNVCANDLRELELLCRQSQFRADGLSDILEDKNGWEKASKQDLEMLAFKKAKTNQKPTTDLGERVQ